MCVCVCVCVYLVFLFLYIYIWICVSFSISAISGVGKLRLLGLMRHIALVCAARWSLQNIKNKNLHLNRDALCSYVDSNFLSFETKNFLTNASISSSL